MNDPQALIDWFQTRSPQSVERRGDFYAADAEFKDPFNEVRGIAAIIRIFEHMFVQVEAPRFVVTGRFRGEGDEDGMMLLWEFHFLRRGRRPQPFRIRGSSHLRFDAAGKVTMHRDYWDAAEELYARLPVLGALMRGLQRMGRA